MLINFVLAKKEYLYIYEDAITTEVQIYIQGISLVITSPNSLTKQLRAGLDEQLKTKSTRLVPLTSRKSFFVLTVITS